MDLINFIRNSHLPFSDRSPIHRRFSSRRATPSSSAASRQALRHHSLLSHPPSEQPRAMHPAPAILLIVHPIELGFRRERKSRRSQTRDSQCSRSESGIPAPPAPVAAGAGGQEQPPGRAATRSARAERENGGYSRAPEIASTSVRQPMLAILRMLAITDGQQTQSGSVRF
jgi:hypothetical protein